MIILRVCFGPNATEWEFSFKTMDAATNAETSLIDGDSITDDFGKKAQFASHPGAIHASVIEDESESAVAVIERSIANAKNQSKFQSMMQNETSVRAASMVQGANRPIVFPGGARN